MGTKPHEFFGFVGAKSSAPPWKPSYEGLAGKKAGPKFRSARQKLQPSNYCTSPALTTPPLHDMFA